MTAYMVSEQVNGLWLVYGYMKSNNALVAFSRDGVLSVAQEVVNNKLMSLGFNSQW